MSRRWVVYPFLVAFYPIVALYAQNADSVALYQVVWPLALTGVAATLVVGLVRLMVQNAARAGLLSVVIFTFFYTAAMAPKWVEGWLRYLSTFWVLTEIHIWPPLIVVPELVAAVLVGWIILRRLREPTRFTPCINVFCLILIAIPATNACVILAREPAKAAQPRVALVAETNHADQSSEARIKPPGHLKNVVEPGDRPDIYYIVLDGYARTDVMSDLFGFDNRPFLERLQKRGFFVAARSTANYCQTPLCLSSSLNSVYLNELIPRSSRDKSQLSEWIGNGAVIRTLHRFGYQFVTFATGFEETEHPDADVYLAPSPYMSMFHQLLIGRTPLNWILPGPSMRDDYVSTRERTLFVLDQVPRIALDRQPTFTFAHILAPHPPFVFGEDGEDVSPHDRFYHLTDGELFQRFYGDKESYVAGYRKQAAYLSRQVELMIDRILANSAKPPVIILQSDHGSGMKLCTNSLEQTDLHERMSILNAYYLPGPGRQAPLYPSISPVNTFRVVFNTYFGADLDLLPDRSYYSTWDDPFVFTDVSRQVRPTGDLGPNLAACDSATQSPRNGDQSSAGLTGAGVSLLLASRPGTENPRGGQLRRGSPDADSVRRARSRWQAN